MSDPRHPFGRPRRGPTARSDWAEEEDDGFAPPAGRARPGAGREGLDVAGRRRPRQERHEPEDDDRYVPRDEIELAGRMDQRPRGRLHRPQAPEPPEEPDDYWAQPPARPAPRRQREPTDEWDAPSAPPPLRPARARPMPEDDWPPAPPTRSRAPDAFELEHRPRASEPPQDDPDLGELPPPSGRPSWPAGAGEPRLDAEPDGSVWLGDNRPFLDPRAERSPAHRPHHGRPGKGRPWAAAPVSEEVVDDWTAEERGRPRSRPEDAPELLLDNSAARPARPRMAEPPPAFRPAPAPAQRNRRYGPRRNGGQARWWPYAALLALAAGGAALWLTLGSPDDDLAAVREELQQRVPELADQVGLGGSTTPPPAPSDAGRIPVSLEEAVVNPPAARTEGTTRFWDQAGSGGNAARPAAADPLAPSAVLPPAPLPSPPKPPFAERATRAVVPAVEPGAPADLNNAAAPTVLDRLLAYVDRLTAAAGLTERDS
jgi:hypothetical protein